jgi:hypothetical protein
MRRADLIQAIRGAGAANDQPLFLRLYTGNRIAYAAAIEAYRQGAAFAARIQARDDTQRA